MKWLLLLTACSHAAPPPHAPNYQPVVTEPAPPQADAYAACLGEAVTNHRYARAHDPDTTILVLTCVGETAHALYDALGPHSAKVGSEFTSHGITYRSTNKVRNDLFGVDYCSSDECRISVNAGDFLR